MMPRKLGVWISVLACRANMALSTQHKWVVDVLRASMLAFVVCPAAIELRGQHRDKEAP